PGFDPNPNALWSYQAYSIIDPSPTPFFRNFLLPINSVGSPSLFAANLFCSAHVWSPFGDLIVVGGTQHTPTFDGAVLTYAFNPKLSVGFFPTTTQTIYRGFFGLWEPGPPLANKRFYPTAVLTHRLQRLANANFPQGRETVSVLGGTVDDTSSDPTVNTTWN